MRRQLASRGADEDRLVDLASDDYLGLARHPRVVEAAAESARTWGAGPSGSRTWPQRQLEATLAAHVGAASSLVLASDHLANRVVLAALSGPQTVVICDAHNQASLLDACRVSGARVVVTPHLDVEAVQQALRERIQRQALVVTEAVFSVDGDAAPLHELYTVTREHGAALLVDEGHATGVVGEGGAGLCATSGLSGLPEVVMSVTLSKALGARGAAVLGSHLVVEHLREAAQPFGSGAHLAPGAAGAALAALELLQEEPWRAAACRDRARELARIAATAGLRRTAPDAAVVALRVGDPADAVVAAGVCAAHGLRVGCLGPPSVPDGIARLRLTARADLIGDDLDRVSSALTAVSAHLAARGR